MSVPAEQVEMPEAPERGLSRSSLDVAAVVERWAQAGASRAAIATVVDLLQREEQDNLADDMTESELGALGEKAHVGYKIDKGSRADWEANQEDHLKAAGQAIEQKSYPWPMAANIKYPLLTVAAIQFNARAYPQIVQGNNIAKVAVVGADEDGEKQARKERVEEYSNYQLLHEMPEWSEGMDRMLLILPILGCAFKKTYFSKLLDRNVSDLVLPKDLVINYHAPSMERASRKTHEFELYPHEIESNMREGVYRRIDLGMPEDGGEDDDAPHKLLEQHRREDLDGDGYAEPIIVTMHKDSRKVLRIKAGYDEDGIEVDKRSGELIRLEPIEYFTRYGFIPNPESAIYDWGFGDLLRSIGRSINTSVNQMLDAGHLQNTPFWLYGRGVRMKAGKYRIEPGQGIPVDTGGGSLRENIYIPQFQGPSMVLFQLLGALIDAGKDIASVKDVLTGEQNANVPATTTLAMIEQGLQVFGGIYKRVHRSLGHELKKLYRLNGRFLEPQKYFRTLDENKPLQVLLQDFEDDDMDIVPVSDPSVVSNQQRLAKAEALLQFNGDPTIDQMEIRKRYFAAAQFESPDALFAKEPPPKDPKALIEVNKQELAVREMDLKEQMAPFERMATLAQALERFAKAEGVEAGSQADSYRLVLDTMRHELEQQKVLSDRAKAVAGMAGAPGDPGVPGLPGALPPAPQ